MADPIVAKELYDLQWGGVNCYPSWQQTPEGLEGRRYFRVFTDEPEEALSALGIPGMWETHPRTPPGVGPNVPVVQALSFFRNPQGAGFIVEATYRPTTPGTSNPDDGAEDGDAFTEVRESTDQVTIRQDVINGDPIPETSIEASKLELIVTCYKASVSAAISAWVNLANKVNTNAVTFPAFRGSTEQVTAVADQLFARNMAIEPASGGLQKITLTFGYGPVKAWKLRWIEEDDEGVPVLGHENDIAPRATFNTGAFWT